MTVGRRLTETAGRYPRRVALVFEGRKVRYAELEAMAEGFAAGLGSLGVSPGDKVGILIANSPEFVVSYFGTVKAGAAAVPLNTFLSAPELNYIIRDSGVKALVFSEEFRERVEALKGCSENLRHFIATGAPGSGELPFSSVVLKGGKGAGALDDGTTAAVLYTSGTTGHPKGAVLTHRNLLSDAESSAKMFRVTKSDTFLLFLPMFHAFSFLVCLLLPLSLGARVIILKSVRPFSNVIRAILLGRVTLFVAIPAVYNVLSMKKFPRLIFRLLPLRLCISGAAPLPLDTWTRFQERIPVPLLEGYGLTEASPVVSCNPIDRQRKPGSVGLPIPGVSVRAVCVDGTTCPPGEVGEIAVKGDNVMAGYLGDEEATADAIKDGWLMTGDMGYIDPEGYIYIVDRKKDLILVHGMNVYPREVEEVLYQHPSVADAAVIGAADGSHGEIPKAFVVRREGASVGERELKEFMKERLASYKIPRHVEFLAALPKSPTGKILKRELRAGKSPA